ncbi:hypothetical protein [Streptomyces sp. NPDC050416]|uniref:hypothetical protein n=1 Tax=Streptomyces sp. NPDC050416 TaxID=3365611 RepID=UPI0037AEFE1D
MCPVERRAERGDLLRLAQRLFSGEQVCLTSVLRVAELREFLEGVQGRLVLGHGELRQVRVVAHDDRVRTTSV